MKRTRPATAAPGTSGAKDFVVEALRGLMPGRKYGLSASVSTDNPEAVGPVLAKLFPGEATVTVERPGEFRIQAEVAGDSARELNRRLLSELRRAERKTRLRAEWTCDGVAERFFDYVPKGTRRA